MQKVCVARPISIEETAAQSVACVVDEHVDVKVGCAHDVKDASCGSGVREVFADHHRAHTKARAHFTLERDETIFSTRHDDEVVTLLRKKHRKFTANTATCARHQRDRARRVGRTLGGRRLRMRLLCS